MQLTILTPDAADLNRYDDWQDQAKKLDLLLNARGVSVDYVSWTTGSDFDSDLVMPLMAWGYHRDIGRWHAQLDRWAASDMRFANPLPVLRWNADKRYLLNFAAQGVSIIPTRYAGSIDLDDLAAARTVFATDDVVIKPPVSAGSDDTWFLRSGETLPDAAHGRAMLIQPMMPAIISEGELSLFWLGDAFAHAIAKRPASGDFRVQTQFGGKSVAVDPPAAALDLANAALVAAGDGVLYARIDMVGDGTGGYALMEIELIEPWLSLDRARDGGAAFADAVIRTMSVHHDTTPQPAPLV
jgi:glutathione synthase/RimK-type ligase-like ATP-grasp enzyme